MDTSSLYASLEPDDSSESDDFLRLSSHVDICQPRPFAARPDISGVTLIDESCFDASCSVQRVAEIFDIGNPDEVALMVPEIKVLGQYCYAALVQIVLPVLCNRTESYSLELQVLIAKELLSVDMSDLDPEKAKKLCAVSMNVLGRCHVIETAEEAHLQLFYGSILEKMIPIAQWNSEEYKELLDFHDKFRTKSSPDHRVMAQKVLSGISHIDVQPHIFNSLVLTRLLNALPDREPVVTSSALDALSTLLATNINLRIYHRLWREILNIWDDNMEVSISGKVEIIEVASKIVTMRKREGIISTRANEAGFISFYRSICRFAVEVSTKDLLFVPVAQCDLIYTIASEFGPLTIFSPRTLDIKSQRAGIDAFTALSTCNEPSIRQKSAFNMPAVSRALSTRYRPTLLKLLQLLATDEESEVRRSLARGIHETIRFIANRRNASHLFAIFNLLLKDEDHAVQLAAVQNFNTIVTTLHNFRPDLNFDELVDSNLIRSITESDWRTGEASIKQISFASNLFSGNWKEECLFVLLAHVFQEGMPPVRRAAGEVFVIAVRSLPGIENRRSSITRFCETVMEGRCALRCALVETLLYAVDQYSQRSYIELFAGKLFDLASDPVSDVRRRVAAELHRLAPSCQEVSRFSRIIEALATDENFSVRAAMVGFIKRASVMVRQAKELEQEDRRKLEFEMSGSGMVFERNGLSSGPAINTGIPYQLAKLFSKRVTARKGGLKTHESFKGTQGRNSISEPFADYGPEVDYVSSSDDENSGDPSQTSRVEDAELVVEREDSRNSDQFSTIAEFFSKQAKDELSTSTATPDPTRYIAGDRGKDFWAPDAPSLFTSLWHRRSGIPSGFRRVEKSNGILQTAQSAHREAVQNERIPNTV